MGFDLLTLGTGLLVFLARVLDVSLGTVRTISIVQGRTVTAFLLGFVEISIWLVVISTVVTKVAETPVLGVFYALGFSTGNVVGIWLERKLAMGATILRVIARRKGRVLAKIIRDSGFAVTTFQGEGKDGPVLELYVVCRRRDVKRILLVVEDLEPGAFYLTERVGSASRIFRPTSQQHTGWRAILKKK